MGWTTFVYKITGLTTNLTKTQQNSLEWHFLKEKKGGFKYEDLYECVFGVGIVPFYNIRVEERRGDLR